MMGMKLRTQSHRVSVPSMDTLTTGGTKRYTHSFRLLDERAPIAGGSKDGEEKDGE